jgi:hypothetical protein
VKLLALLLSNPARRALVHTMGVQRYSSPLNTTIVGVARRLKNITTKPLIGNPLWVYAPWVGLSRRVVITEKDQAIKDANLIAQARITSLYPDASVATRLTAIAVAKRYRQAATVVLQESIGFALTCGILTAEIAAIAAALDYA